MASAAVTNFALNFGEDVRWAMCLRLKPDVLAAIRDAPDASHIRFATNGGTHAIEVGDKTFVLDCREEKTGATICEAHRDWGRGEITEVGVAKLRGDVQTTFAEKQTLAASKQNHNGADLHDRILEASCIRIAPEKKIPSSAGTHNRNTVIVPMKTLLPGLSLLSPPIQVPQEKQPDSRGTSPARGRQTPPKLTEANGDEVPRATLEEVARAAASHGKLRFCVMALLSARNFRVRRKLGQDVITLCREGRHENVPSESTVEMTIKKVSQMSSWGITLTDQARTELIDTVLPQFRTGSWAAVSTPIGSPADGTLGKSSGAAAVRVSGSKLNPQKAAAAVPQQQKALEAKNGEDDGSKRKAHDSDSTHKRKKHKSSSKKEGHRGREHDSSKHRDKEKGSVKEGAENKAVSRSGAGNSGDGGRGTHKDETKEAKKIRKESRRHERKPGKRDREKDKERGNGGKGTETREGHEKRRDRKGEKRQKLSADTEAAVVSAMKHARSYEEERADKEQQRGKPPSAERDRGGRDGAVRSRQPSPATVQHPSGLGSAEANAGPITQAAKSNGAPEGVRVQQPPADASGGKQGGGRSVTPPAGEKAKLDGGCQDKAGADVPAKLSSPIPPKVVPPKVAVELLEGDGKAMPAWLEAADEGALADSNTADHSEHDATPCIDPVQDGSERVEDRKTAVVDGDGNVAAASEQQRQTQRQEEKNRSKVVDDEDDDDDFSVWGHAGPPPRGGQTTGWVGEADARGAGGQQDQPEGDVHSDFAVEEDFKAVEEPGKDTREGRSGTPDGISEQGEDPEDDHRDEAWDGAIEDVKIEGSNGGVAGGTRQGGEVQLNAEEVAQYLEVVIRGNGQLCLDKKQLVRDYAVFAWLVREVQEEKSVLQRVPQSAATGAEVVSQHADALREFDANHVVWFQKSKLMSLLYHRLQNARNAVAAAKAQQQSRTGLPKMA